MNDWSFGTILFALDWTFRLAALWWIPSRSAPAAARSWLLLAFFMPLLGLPLYLLLGQPWLSEQRRRRQGQASQAIREGQAPQRALRWQPPDTGPAAETVPLVERMGDFMAVRGNAVELLDDYDGSIRALVADIDAAQARVHLLYYLMFDDTVGQAVADALIRAAGRGVHCRLLLDAVGGKQGWRRFHGPLRAAGVKAERMMPGGLRWRRSSRMDLRNHRKIAVIDDHVGYVGSQNLADAVFVPGHPNRELVARARGPIVSHMEAVFASDWYLETGETLEVSPVRPVHDEDMAAQLLPSGPAYPFGNAGEIVNSLIHLAQHRLVLTTPYFVPDDATLSALRIASLSGVDVQLVLSATNNKRLLLLAQQSYYEELLAAGVKIALYQPHFMHAKHLSVDDSVALVSSINLDIRSFALNAEIGLLCYDRDVVARMHEIEADYLAHSEMLSLEQWRRRPSWQRSLEGLARLADSFM